MNNGKGCPKLYQYQKEDVVAIEDFDGTVLNANEMGLGKTIETLISLKRNQDWLPALVVCPASVKYNWKFEALHYTGFNSSVCEGQTPPRYNKYDFAIQTPLTFINYDILKYWLPYLKHFDFKTVVFDECQALQNPYAQRTKAAKSFAVRMQHVMMLSGTPLTNRPSELWSVLNMLWPAEFPSFTEYAQVFCRPRYTPWGWNYDGAENLDILHAKCKRLGMIRRLRSDVLKDLPKQTRCIERCELSNPKEYQDAQNDFMTWIKKSMPHRARSAVKAEALSKIGYLVRLAGRLKLKSPVDWANKFLEETNEKLVMFAVHERAIDVLKRRIKAESVVIDGSIDGEMRHHLVQQFQNDQKTRVFIGSRAAWSGVTLTAASTTGVTELFWRPGDHIQAEARTCRIGQDQKSFVHYFVAVGTIEERLCQLLQEKQKTISAVLDGGPCPQDLNLFEILLSEIQEGKTTW